MISKNVNFHMINFTFRAEFVQSGAIQWKEVLKFTWGILNAENMKSKVVVTYLYFCFLCPIALGSINKFGNSSVHFGCFSTTLQNCWLALRDYRSNHVYFKWNRHTRTVYIDLQKLTWNILPFVLSLCKCFEIKEKFTILY